MGKEYQGKHTRTYKKLYGYKNLIVWQKADDLSAQVNRCTLSFGRGYFHLADQMRGSAVSVKSNIVEGYCRNTLGDYIRFCEIARGSLGELGSQIQDGERWGLIKNQSLVDLLELYSETTWLLERLITSLMEKRKSGEWNKDLTLREAEMPYFAGDADLPFQLPEEDEESP